MTAPSSYTQFISDKLKAQVNTEPSGNILYKDQQKDQQAIGQINMARGATTESVINLL